MNAEKVQVLDGLVSVSLQQDLLAFVRQPIWRYGWSSEASARFRYWHAEFVDNGNNSTLSCEAELKTKPHCEVIYRLWKLLESGPLAGHIPIRVYANAHTYGTEGYVHEDCKEDEPYFTTIYYASALWHPNWSGETQFLTPDGKDIEKSVYPMPGRVCMFPGYILHRALAPSRECPELRVAIVIKTYKTPGA